MAPRTMVVLATVVVVAVAMTAAQLPHAAHALDLCSTTGSCVRVGDGKITYVVLTLTETDDRVLTKTCHSHSDSFRKLNRKMNTFT